MAKGEERGVVDVAKTTKNKMIWIKMHVSGICLGAVLAPCLGEQRTDEIVVPKSSIFLQIYHVKTRANLVQIRLGDVNR